MGFDPDLGMKQIAIDLAINRHSSEESFIAVR